MNRAKLLMVGLSLGLMVLGMVANANALLITPSTTPQWISTDNSGWDADKVEGLVGSLVDLTEYYKQNAGGSEEKALWASYDTTFYFTGSTDKDYYGGKIEYTGGPYISGSPIYLLVKDGHHIPAAYVFDLSALGWNGTDTIFLGAEGNWFWPDGGSISHVSLFGVSTTTPVPEPGTLLLLGSGLVALAGARRSRK